MSSLTLDPAAGLWLEASHEAFREFARDALLYSGEVEFGETRTQMSDGTGGGFVAMLGATIRSQVGVVADEEGMHVLCRALLQMEPGEPRLMDDELTDAMGEVANMLAGQLKSKLEDVYPGLELGLPMFLRGRIQPAERQSLAVQSIKFGNTSCEIVFLLDRTH